MFNYLRLMEKNINETQFQKNSFYYLLQTLRF